MVLFVFHDMIQIYLSKLDHLVYLIANLIFFEFILLLLSCYLVEKFIVYILLCLILLVSFRCFLFEGCIFLINFLSLFLLAIFGLPGRLTISILRLIILWICKISHNWPFLFSLDMDYLEPYHYWHLLHFLLLSDRTLLSLLNPNYLPKTS